MYHILICDDEPDIVSALRIYLSGEGYALHEARTGAQALEILRRQEIHLVLMDIMMPEMDGITATARLREESNVPVILLTAKGEDADKILGLNIGADDYVTKPFQPAELLARVRSQLRRYVRLGGYEGAGDELRAGGIVLDDAGKTVTVDGEAVTLTPIEFAILRLLMRNPDRVFSSAQIYRQVWEEPPCGSEGVVAVHIRHLREKIEIDPSEPRYIKVVWGQGYKLERGRGE